MWATDRVRASSKRKKNTDQSQNTKNTKFDEYLTAKYSERIQKVEKEKKELMEQLDKILSEHEKLEHETSRGLIRRKKQIVKEKEKLQLKLSELERGDCIEDFKNEVLPFVDAYERELQVTAIEKMRNVSNSQSESAHLLPKQDDKNDSKLLQSNSVMKDFMRDIEHIQPEVKVMPSEICDECDYTMELESRSSLLVCSCCGNWRPYLDATSSHMAYGEEVEFTNFAYLRLNHFNERLTYSQAKESTRIDVQDIKRVMDRLIEKRITDPNKITMEMTYAIAKELKMRHVYKQNTQLWSRITGKSPLRMSPEHEEQLRSMFRAVNRLWPKYKPEERKNFLSYNYCLYKFCELLGLDDYLPLYKLLKGDKKLEKQDEIFQKICDDPELQWQFIPSKND